MMRLRRLDGLQVGSLSSSADLPKPTQTSQAP